MSRLPSLTALRAFEAAARLRSMSRAANELCVTHGAISRQIQILEADIGMPLLRRLPRSVEPSAEGARLAAALSTAFGLMREGVAQLRTGPVVVSCSASIMMRWLIPRLPCFSGEHPDVNLRLSANHGTIDLVREGVDLAIRNDIVPAPKGVSVRPLLREWIGPVCSPDYARSVDLRRPEDLVRAALLATRTRLSAWQDWCVASGIDLPVEEPKNVFEHFYMVLQAAACGLGVTVSPRILVEDDLVSGRLVAPFGFIHGHRQLVIWKPLDDSRRADVTCVEHWLDHQLAASAGNHT